MQRVMQGDVVAFAAALARVPPDQQAALGREMLGRADQAAAHRMRYGVAHPKWGCGSLMAVARGEGQVRALDWQDAGFLAACAMVCRLLVAHFSEGSDLSERRSRCTGAPSDQAPDV